MSVVVEAVPGVRAVQAAVAALADGRAVIVTDDSSRENEADIVIAAEHASSEHLAFMVRHTTGIICAPMSGERLDALALPQMVADNTERHATAFTITVDHVDTTTGVSADDRARTLRALANSTSAPSQFRRPGHIFPLRYREGGVLRRAGHTEAAIDLLKLAEREPVAAIGELVADSGAMMRGEQVLSFAATHGLPVVSVAELVRYRRSQGSLVVRSGTADLPTPMGAFLATAYRSLLDDVEHLSLTLGDVSATGATREGALVRVHSECLTGDVLGSLRCDCGTQLEQALAAIQANGSGALVYLRGQEGRGIGLGHKLRAYALQEQGRDTVDANLELGLPVDSRRYGVGAAILADLGIRRIRLITNNPEKYSGLEGHGLTIVSRVHLPPVVTHENAAYLATKRTRMGHLIDVPDSEAPARKACNE